MTALLVGSLAALAGCQGDEAKTDSKAFDFTADRLVIDSRETALVIDQGTTGSIGVDRTLKGNATDAGAATLSMEGGVLKVWVECSGVTFSCEASHTVHVPPGVAIELKSSGSRVQAQGLTGDVTAELSNDATIALAEPSGALSLDARGGSITVTAAKSPQVTAIASTDGNVSLEFAAAPERVEAQSTGGYASVALPAGPETYRVDAANAQGLAHDPASSRIVSVRASEGRATVTKAE